VLIGWVWATLSRQPFKESIDVSASGLEREVRAHSDVQHKCTDMQHKCKALTDLLAVKDQMIWSLLQVCEHIPDR
jgi:hypothetical protein